MPYKGPDALKAKIDDPVVRAWALYTLKDESRTKLFAFLQFWRWAKRRTVKDPNTGEEKVVGADEILMTKMGQLRARAAS